MFEKWQLCIAEVLGIVLLTQYQLSLSGTIHGNGMLMADGSRNKRTLIPIKAKIVLHSLISFTLSHLHSFTLHVSKTFYSELKF